MTTFQTRAWIVAALVAFLVSMPSAALAGMAVTIKTVTGKTLVLSVGANDTVASVKQKIAEKEGIPEPQQRLIFKGKSIADERTLSDYGIQSGATIYLVLRVGG